MQHQTRKYKSLPRYEYLFCNGLRRTTYLFVSNIETRPCEKKNSRTLSAVTFVLVTMKHSFDQEETRCITWLHSKRSRIIKNIWCNLFAIWVHCLCYLHYGGYCKFKYYRISVWDVFFYKVMSAHVYKRWRLLCKEKPILKTSVVEPSSAQLAKVGQGVCTQSHERASDCVTDLKLKVLPPCQRHWLKFLIRF